MTNMAKNLATKREDDRLPFVVLGAEQFEAQEVVNWKPVLSIIGWGKRSEIMKAAATTDFATAQAWPMPADAVLVLLPP